MYGPTEAHHQSEDAITGRAAHTESIHSHTHTQKDNLAKAASLENQNKHKDDAPLLPALHSTQ